MVIAIGSGEAGVEQKGDKSVELVCAVAIKAPAPTQLDAFGSKGNTNTERTFGIPFDTRILNGLLTD